MADKPFIIPTFTFDTFRKNRLSLAEHVVDGTMPQDSGAGASSAMLMNQLKKEGIEIDSPYEAFFTDGAPPPNTK